MRGPGSAIVNSGSVRIRTCRCTVVACTVVACTVVACTVIACTVIACTVVACTVVACTVVACTVVACTVVACTVVACTVVACTVSTVDYCLRSTVVTVVESRRHHSKASPTPQRDGTTARPRRLIPTNSGIRPEFGKHLQLVCR